MMIDKGVSFQNSFVDFPLCCPSRASLLSGQASHNIGVLGNKKAEFGGRRAFLPREKDALPVRLQIAGYNTGFFGKYLNHYGHGVPPGWDRWVAYWRVAKQYKYRLNIDGKIKRFGEEPKDYGDDVISDFAADWIRDADSSKPIFVLVATKNPHEPYIPPERHDGAFADLPLPVPPNFNEADISDKPAFNQPPLLSPDISQKEGASGQRISETCCAATV